MVPAGVGGTNLSTVELKPRVVIYAKQNITPLYMDAKIVIVIPTQPKPESY